jgi:hypothetical protein
MKKLTNPTDFVVQIAIPSSHRIFQRDDGNLTRSEPTPLPFANRSAISRRKQTIAQHSNRLRLLLSPVFIAKVLSALRIRYLVRRGSYTAHDKNNQQNHDKCSGQTVT